MNHSCRDSTVTSIFEQSADEQMICICGETGFLNLKHRKFILKWAKLSHFLLLLIMLKLLFFTKNITKCPLLIKNNGLIAGISVYYKKIKIKIDPFVIYYKTIYGPVKTECTQQRISDHIKSCKCVFLL